MLTITSSARFVAVLVGAFLLVLPPVYAQKKGGKGRIKGLVSDAAGTGIEGSRVSFEKADMKFEATTDARGLFEIEVPAGLYQVEAEKGGDSPAVKLSNIRVKADRFTMLRLQLKEGDSCAPADTKGRKAEKKPAP